MDDGGDLALQVPGVALLLELERRHIAQKPGPLHHRLRPAGLEHTVVPAPLGDLPGQRRPAEGGQHQHLRPVLPQLLQHLQPVHAREHQVHHHHIRPVAGNQIQQLLAAGRLGAHRQVRLPAYHIRQHLAKLLRGVRQHNLLLVAHVSCSFPVCDLSLTIRFTKIWYALKIPQNPPHGKKVFHIFSNYSSTTLVIIRPHTDFWNQKTRNYN